MKVDLHANGSIKLILTPENIVEKAAVEVMLAWSQKGAIAKIEAAGEAQGMSLTMAE
jgi:hypothetical protein